MADPDLTGARLTHVALPCADLDRSIEFYTTLTPLVVVKRFPGTDGESVWLSNEGEVENPFVLVLVSFTKDQGSATPTLTPFAHLGVEVATREAVDAMADRARALGALNWEPRDIGGQVGYICALRDPDGNVVEISTHQGVSDAVRALWG